MCSLTASRRRRLHRSLALTQQLRTTYSPPCAAVGSSPSHTHRQPDTTASVRASQLRDVLLREILAKNLADFKEKHGYGWENWALWQLSCSDTRALPGMIVLLPQQLMPLAPRHT